MEDFKREFDCHKLCEWINLKLHFGEDYNDLLITNHINGESFLELDLHNLGEIGIQPIGHRLRFFGLVRTERKKLDLPKLTRKRN